MLTHRNFTDVLIAVSELTKHFLMFDLDRMCAGEYRGEISLFNLFLFKQFDVSY